ncbi:bifunctional precorrin-2 dehydrogenase/sirohydrochlorin ferrochelatase [Bacillus sp. Marseille-Q1617]|uniref:precorrin-2 dehydrogenase/sirohydrochlorin ferrochelatase family protein n=1 Tax=Bacillus sp. Marseille-Q1617 TaxID=2736887 RepID=UPI00158B8FE1|nr:NAD(P)-dependent oxidoreductase [Bacillus sp. Marseille-Q1617]
MLPLMVEMKERRVTVAGGGRIALRKLLVFLEHGAEVTVVSPQAVEGIRELAVRKEIQWKQKTVEKADLEDAWFIIAATDQKKINEWIKRQASPYQLVSLVDQGENSDFQMTSFMQKGYLTISVSTNGASPYLAKKLCSQFMEQSDDLFIESLSYLAKRRKEINQTALSREEKFKLLKDMADEL